jgi:hypothetical protein
MGWTSFWMGVAFKAQAKEDEYARRLAEHEAGRTMGQKLNIPPCIFCHDKRRDFKVVQRFTFSIDRLSRGRVKALLRCNNCGMQAVIMRWGDRSTWSWFEAN